MNWSLIIVEALIIACCTTRCHIVVLEKNEEIFKAILQSIKKTIPPVVTTKVNEPSPTIEASQDLDVMIIKPHKFVCKARPNK